MLSIKLFPFRIIQYAFCDLFNASSNIFSEALYVIFLM
jgi:hypothetical protein